VLQCCGAAVGRGEEARGWRLEAEGKISNVKAQMTKPKWRDLWEIGKTSSERESKIFFVKSWEPRIALGNSCNEAGLEMIEKRFLSGEERVFSRRRGRGWRQKERCQMTNNS
jgi:hypothetical protein